MNFCVLVKISKYKVSFWYQSEGNLHAPLIIKGTNIIPLIFYVNGNDFIFGNAARESFNSNNPNAFGNYFEIVKDPSKHFNIYGNKKPVKQLLYYGIEQYLSYFINTVLYKSDSIESYRQQFPLRFLFETDIEDKEKTLIENLFTDAGYYNVEIVNYKESLFEVLCNSNIISGTQPTLLLNGIDNILYLELYKNFSAAPSGFSKLEGQGSDPRVKILADMIIEDILMTNSYLSINKEAEINALLLYSANLLENILPIIKGNATLTDGKSYHFEVKNSILNERLLYNANDNIIAVAIDDMLKLNDLNVVNTTILLGSKEINTNYFSNKLLKKYPNVKGIEAVHSNEAMKLVFSKIAQSDYLVKKIVLPPTSALPNQNNNQITNIENKKPPLPEFKKIPKPPLPEFKNTAKQNLPENKKPPLPPFKNDKNFYNSNFNKLNGKEGIVLGDLNPVGKIEIEGEIYDAVCDTSWISNGQRVRIIDFVNDHYKVIQIVKLPPLPPPLPPKKKVNSLIISH